MSDKTAAARRLHAAAEAAKEIADQYINSDGTPVAANSGETGKRSEGRAMNADEVLLGEINKAVAAANEAEQMVETARTELVSRSKAVGELLLEAKKRHPKVKAFEAFLKRVNGLNLSRAYDLLRLAGGRTTDAELREETRQRVRKHRAKKKLPPPEPKALSVTDPDITESPNRITQSPEISADARRIQNAAFDAEPEPAPLPEPDPSGEEGVNKEYEDWLKAGDEAEKASAKALAEFTIACHTWLPKMREQHYRDQARRLVNKMTEPLKTKVA
jgi:hypothetical protein